MPDQDFRLEDGRGEMTVPPRTGVIADDVASGRGATARGWPPAKMDPEDLLSFALSISHDMKSPSNTMHLILKEILETQSPRLDPDGRQLVAFGLQTVDRMRRRIDDVLAFVRASDTPPRFGPVCLDTLVSSCLEDLRSDSLACGANITVAPLPVVLGYDVQLRTLFDNLLGNALKYRDIGRAPHIRIEAAPSVRPGFCDICVSDNGIGIAARDRARVFEMFERLNMDTRVEGTGIGLALCRRIARSHGGDITLRSKAGHGSRFAVSLRRA